MPQVIQTYLDSNYSLNEVRQQQLSIVRQYKEDISQFPVASALDVLQGSPSANYGAVYENIVAQELNTFVPCLYYYRNNRKGEVDFLLETRLRAGA